MPPLINLYSARPVLPLGTSREFKPPRIAYAVDPLFVHVSVQRLGEKVQFGAVQMARRWIQSLLQPCRSSGSVLIYLCIFRAIFGIGTVDHPVSAVITPDR